MVTCAKFCDEHAITMAATQVPVPADKAETYKGGTAWRCDFSLEKRKFSTTFHMGSGHSPKPAPTIASVFDCLMLDSDVLDHADFESWASDFGYDLDSRAGERTYNECLAQTLNCARF